MTTNTLARVRQADTATKLQVAGSAGVITWLAISIIPFFPVLMALLVLAGVAMKMKARS